MVIVGTRLFAPDGGAQTIAGVSTAVTGGSNIVAMFGQWGAILHAYPIVPGTFACPSIRHARPRWRSGSAAALARWAHETAHLRAPTTAGAALTGGCLSAQVFTAQCFVDTRFVCRKIEMMMSCP